VVLAVAEFFQVMLVDNLLQVKEMLAEIRLAVPEVVVVAHLQMAQITLVVV
jgi:hypothetical protein